jgi:hypothetical protein
LYHSRGCFAEAEPLYQETQAIRENHVVACIDRGEFEKSVVEALWKPYIDTYSIQICVILSSILAAMDELVKKSRSDEWYLPDAGRSGRWAARGQGVGGCRDVWRGAWLFSWKRGVRGWDVALGRYLSPFIIPDGSIA